MQTGSCHCGKVKFELTGPLSDAIYCYCGTCRKLSGGAFAAVVKTPESDFKITEGAEHLNSYQSIPGKHRHYCKTCFSPIYVQLEAQPEQIRIRLGLLDFEPKVGFAGHIWVSEKPDWYIISDDLPQYDEWPT